MSPRVSGRRSAEKEKGFIWLPREKDLVYSIKIDSVVETNNYFSAEFTRAIFPEIGSFKIDLINADGNYNGKYVSGTIVDFYIDLDGSGPTKRFSGKVDTIKNIYENSTGYVLTIEGGHVSSNDLLTTHVTEKYTGDKTCDEIYIELFGKYLTGYTTTNVTASSVKPTITWDRKPLIDCLFDLCKLADFEGYVDDDKDGHFFAKKSIHNSDEAIVWNDTMISTNGLNIQSLDTRNYIQVYGEDDTGLPIIATSEDKVSQGLYDKKEEIIVDNSVSSVAEGDELAIALKDLKKTPELEGKALSLVLPTISPGQTIYIVDPTMKINDKYPIARYTHKFPNQLTECIIHRRRALPTLFKERIEKELGLQTSVNPNKMTRSINLQFNDYAELVSYSDNLEVVSGKLRLASGTQGTATSQSHAQSFTVNQIHLLVIGEQFNSTLFKVSADGGENYQTVSVDKLTTLLNPGNNVIIEMVLNNASTEIDSVALLLK